MFRTKCPSLRLIAPPPAQCTMNASRMMAVMTTTTQKKNTMMPGMAYPAIALVLATAVSYPLAQALFNAEVVNGAKRETPRCLASQPGEWKAIRAAISHTLTSADACVPASA